MNRVLMKLNSHEITGSNKIGWWTIHDALMKPPNEVKKFTKICIQIGSRKAQTKQLLSKLSKITMLRHLFFFSFSILRMLLYRELRIFQV